MSSSGIVRAFRYCLLCFDIERSVNHFVFLRPYMYFRAEADDISGGGQDKRTIYRHEIRQEMSAFKNRLIKFGQAIIPDFLVLFPADLLKPVLSPYFRECSNRGKNQFAITRSRLSVFNPVLWANRSVGTD